MGSGGNGAGGNEGSSSNPALPSSPAVNSTEPSEDTPEAPPMPSNSIPPSSVPSEGGDGGESTASDETSAESPTQIVSNGGAAGEPTSTEVPASGGATAGGAAGEPANTSSEGGTAGQGEPTDVSDAGAGGSGGEVGPGVVGIVAVGYGGLRVVSRDGGETWENETHWSESGGDDFDLLRTIAYGNGLWLSGGWRITTSADAVTWTDQGNAEDIIDAVNCPVTDGLAFGAGRFLVACGSNLATSTDGASWERVGPTPDVGGHPYLFFDAENNQFACSGDDGTSFVSSDGAEWTELAIDTVHWCENGLTAGEDCPSFYYDGAFLRAEWGGFIQRSLDGSDWDTVYNDQFENNLFTEYAFAVGQVQP